MKNTTIKRIKLIPKIADGFTSIANFHINDKEEMKVVTHKELPQEIIIAFIKQWIEQVEKKQVK